MESDVTTRRLRLRLLLIVIGTAAVSVAATLGVQRMLARDAILVTGEAIVPADAGSLTCPNSRYPDIIQGVSLTVTDVDGNELATATLGPTEVPKPVGGGWWCRYPFTMDVPKGYHTYTLLLGRQPKRSIAEADLHQQLVLSFR